MKKFLFVIVALLAFAGGCIYIPGNVSPSSTNQPPAAYIDSITPSSVAPGEQITFIGHGTDVDGTVVAYRWRSSISGELSSMATFDTKLDPGDHIIYFKVQDNNGDWSDEASNSVTVSGVTPPAGAPVINSFSASPTNIAIGGSSTLSWNVTGATSVSINQGVGSVGAVGNESVSPGTTTTYTLTATNSAGSITATTQVVVSGTIPPSGLPVINSFSASPPTIAAGGSTTLSWDVSNATSVVIDPGVGSVSSVGSVVVSPVASTSYTLMATNSSGWSSMTFPVLVTGGGPTVAYDFVEKAPTAYWWTKIGADLVGLIFPGALNDNKGFATYQYNIKLNDGDTYTRVLETHPQWIDNGWISGKYSGVYVPPGSKLRIKVGLINGAGAGNVKFYIGKLGAVATISLNVSYADGVKVMEADLDAYAGQTIDFVLGVNALGSSAQDWAAWAEAKIIY